MAGRDPIWCRHLILVTGKGGVGKTTIASALARAAHAGGNRVLIAEVTNDPTTPSPLLSLFGHALPVGDEPFEIEPRLYGTRLSPSAGHKLFLRAALKINLIVDTAMKSAALTRFLMAAPTFPEIGVLYQIVTLLRSRMYDRIIVDLPATGHALALAMLPRTVLRIVPGGLIGDAIREGLETMTDPKRTCAVVVTLPESMPVTEAMELTQGLTDLKIPVEALILNRMPGDPFTREERDALQLLIHTRTTAQGAHGSGGGEGQDASGILGVREFRKLERAKAARATFQAAAPAGVRTLEIPLFASLEPRSVIAQTVAALEVAH